MEKPGRRQAVNSSRHLQAVINQLKLHGLIGLGKIFFALQQKAFGTFCRSILDKRKTQGLQLLGGIK